MHPKELSLRQKAALLISTLSLMATACVGRISGGQEPSPTQPPTLPPSPTLLPPTDAPGGEKISTPQAFIESPDVGEASILKNEFVEWVKAKGEHMLPDPSQIGVIEISVEKNGSRQNYQMVTLPPVQIEGRDPQREAAFWVERDNNGNTVFSTMTKDESEPRFVTWGYVSSEDIAKLKSGEISSAQVQNVLRFRLLSPQERESLQALIADGALTPEQLKQLELSFTPPVDQGDNLDVEPESAFLLPEAGGVIDKRAGTALANLVAPTATAVLPGSDGEATPIPPTATLIRPTNLPPATSKPEVIIGKDLLWGGHPAPLGFLREQVVLDGKLHFALVSGLVNRTYQTDITVNGQSQTFWMVEINFGTNPSGKSVIGNFIMGRAGDKLGKQIMKGRSLPDDPGAVGNTSISGVVVDVSQIVQELRHNKQYVFALQREIDPSLYADCSQNPACVEENGRPRFPYNAGIIGEMLNKPEDYKGQQFGFLNNIYITPDHPAGSK